MDADKQAQLTAAVVDVVRRVGAFDNGDAIKVLVGALSAVVSTAVDDVELGVTGREMRALAWAWSASC